MLVIRFKVQVQPDKIDEALEMFAAVPPPSREVEGVISFDIGRDLNDPNAIVATEVFQDAAARERQESLPEVARVMGSLPDLLAAPPEATIFEVASTSDPFAATAGP
jgi:quinol monooxygenase YgiN